MNLEIPHSRQLPPTPTQRPYAAANSNRLRSEFSANALERSPRASIGRRMLCGIGWLACSLCIGCAGYQLGNATLYNPDVRTIYVPIIRNDTFRHEIGVQLTEAVHKAIELRTPYKVIADPSADSTLTCRVTSQTKRTVTEAATDEPRAVETLLTVQVTWTDRQGNLLMENRYVPLGELAFYFIQGMDFVPEGGQSMATAQQRAVERLADQIVNQMETRW